MACFGSIIVEEMRRRFLTFTIMGASFGVLNWFFLNQVGVWLDGLVGRGRGPRPANPLMDDLTQWSGLALWLVPALLVILVEIRTSHRPALSALAVTLLWLAADVTYYVIYTGKLLLGLGGPQLGVRLDQGWATYWQGVSQLRLHQMVGRDFVLWTTVALVGGPIVGWLGGAMVLRVMRWWQSPPGQSHFTW